MMDGKWTDARVPPVARLTRADTRVAAGRRQRGARPVRCSLSPATSERNGGDIVSDRALWLEERCPTCRAAPGARCRMSSLRRTIQPTRLHVTRGWRERPCSTCKSLPGDSCRTPSGRQASHTHEARLRPGRHELVLDESVWQAIEARGDGRFGSVRRPCGRGGRVDRIVLSRLVGGELVDVERRTDRDELCYALEAPVWDRFGSFAGQPQIAGTVVWTRADRRVVIEGRRVPLRPKRSPQKSLIRSTSRIRRASRARLGDRLGTGSLRPCPQRSGSRTHSA